MLDDRRQTIIKEIHFWKENKLLPDVYCDYLLALYTQGEDNNEGIEQFKSYPITLAELVCSSLVLIMVFLSFLMVYVFDMLALWELGLLAMICLFSTGLFWLMRKNTNYWYHVRLISLLLIYLIFSIQLGLYFTAYPWLINTILLINFIGWLYVSSRKKLKYLTIVSIISIVFMIIYLISRYFAT